MFIQYIIPLISSFFAGGSMFTLFFLPVLCLSFLATVPFILMYFFRR